MTRRHSSRISASRRTVVLAVAAALTPKKQNPEGGNYHSMLYSCRRGLAIDVSHLNDYSETLGCNTYCSVK